MKPRKLRRRLADLEARISALESDRTPGEVAWSTIPDAEPLDALTLWRTHVTDYAHGWDEEADDWRNTGTVDWSHAGYL